MRQNQGQQPDAPDHTALYPNQCTSGSQTWTGLRITDENTGSWAFPHRFWFSRSGRVPRLFISNEFPGHADAAQEPRPENHLSTLMLKIWHFLPYQINKLKQEDLFIWVDVGQCSSGGGTGAIIQNRNVLSPRIPVSWKRWIFLESLLCSFIKSIGETLP